MVLFEAGSLMSYFGLLDWIFIIYFIIFKLTVFAYMCIYHNDDEADLKLPKTVVVAYETIQSSIFNMVREHTFHA